MRASSRSSMPASLARSAQSWISPKANAVWECSPTRMGWVSHRQPRPELRRGDELEGLQRGPPPPRRRVVPLAQLGRELQQPRRPVRPLEAGPPRPLEVAHLGRDVLHGQAAVERGAGRRREVGVGIQPRQTGEQPLPVHRRVPVEAPEERRRQTRAAGARRRRRSGRGRSCWGIRGARTRGPAVRTAPPPARRPAPVARRRPGRRRPRAAPLPLRGPTAIHHDPARPPEHAVIRGMPHRVTDQPPARTPKPAFRAHDTL